MIDAPTYPMRINRALALRGLATRRGADDLIRAGRVLVNGTRARLGDRVNELDELEIVADGKTLVKPWEYLAYYKPRGVITHSPQGSERSIQDVRQSQAVFPVGRLDKDSEGLIILTNDGRVTERLLHPRFAHEKEYLVTVRERSPLPVKKLLEGGIMSEGERLSAKRVRFLDPHTLSMVLTEGKKHQIRRMLSAVHLTVEKLVRVRILQIHLGSLRPGKSRRLVGKAREAFLADLGLT